MLEIRHIELSEANAYVTENHRHHKAVRGHRFSLACYAAVYGWNKKCLLQVIWSQRPGGKGTGL